MIGGAKGIGIGIDFGIPNQYCRATSKPYIEKDVLDSLRVVASAYGKSNNDSDRAIVKNLVDPDNPFVISNAAYTEGSGYADKGSPYYGAFVTDGIADLITSTKTVQEMLGESNEITVVSMIHQVKDSANNVSFTNYIRGSANGYFRNIVNNYDKTGIYGYTSSDLMGLSVVNNILGDKNDYTSNGDNRDSIINGNFSVQGYSYNDGNNTGDFSSVAWYWTIIANKVLTTDQINQVIAYFNLDRTLKSDIYCNIAKQGITNENHAQFGDKLIDYSGNSRDLQLFNIGWNLGSGIGKYEVDFLDWAMNLPFINERTSFTFSSFNDNNNDIITVYQRVPAATQSFLIKAKLRGSVLYRYYVNNGDTISVSYYEVKEGINILPDSADPTSVNGKVGFVLKGLSSVKVEQIPSHAGGLCLDGVNDYGKVTGLPIYKDYTVIADYIRTFAKENVQDAPILSKSKEGGDGAFIFNYVDYSTSKTLAYSFANINNVSYTNDFERNIYYQSKYTNNGNSINAGTGVDTNSMWLGTYRDNVQNYFTGAIYSLMSFPYSMSEFLIERQLKKHKLGTLYPDMVEFRPVIKSNVLLDAKPTFVIRGTSTYLNAGDYVPENSQIWVSIKMNNIADRITKFTVNGKTIDIPENAYSEVTLQYGFPFVIDKSPQKISITIEQDENYVKFEPVITSNVEYVRLDFYLNNYQKRINIGDYIPKDAYLRANFYLKNNVDELTVFTFNGVNIGYRRSSVDDTAFNINQIYNYDSPQEVDITIDEYIRYEDIVQPYPVLLRFKDENGNEVSWGDKIKVGSSITRIGSFYDCNLLKGIYTVSNAKLNGSPLPSTPHVVERQMVFTCTATYLLDDNEPKCILSPRLLSIPNSSYKILGYIPDISGHGNNGVINNSAYAEGSGVNEDGSYQFDGVDDFVTIPTLSSGGKQMLMKVNWNSLNHVLYDQRNNAEAPFCIVTASGSIAYNQRNVGGNTYIDGILNNHILVADLQAITHNIVLNNDYNVANSNSFIGTNYTKSIYAKMSLYDFMLFDNISTDDKIKELNEYVGIEGDVWGILTKLSNSTLISNETLIKNE